MNATWKLIAALSLLLVPSLVACDDPENEEQQRETADPSGEESGQDVGGAGGMLGKDDPVDDPDPSKHGYEEDDSYFEITMLGGPLDGETLLAKKAGAGLEATQNVGEGDTPSFQFRSYPVEGRDITANFQFYWEGSAAVGQTANRYDANGDKESGKLGSLVLFGIRLLKDSSAWSSTSKKACMRLSRSRRGKIRRWDGRGSCRARGRQQKSRPRSRKGSRRWGNQRASPSNSITSFDNRSSEGKPHLAASLASPLRLVSGWLVREGA